MKPLVNAALLATLVTLLAGMAVAEPSETAGSQVWGSGEVQPRDESELWVPSLALTSGMLVEDAQASVASSLRASEDPPFFEDSGAGTLIGPLVSGSLELMAPALSDHWGRPRFFAHAGAGGNFALEYDVAKTGNPGTLEEPPAGHLKPPVDQPGVVKGQGSTTSVQPRYLQLSAGGGIAFSFDAWGRRFRIKPSFEYLREEVEVTGVMSGATIALPGVEEKPKQNIEYRSEAYNLFTGSASKRQVFHGIGPGLELEADVARSGSLVWSVLMSGGAYWIPGDRTVNFSATLEQTQTPSSHPVEYPLPALASPPHTATWEYKKDPWSYRAHFGIRLRWAPDS
jgi:hypothetical protein